MKVTVGQLKEMLAEELGHQPFETPDPHSGTGEGGGINLATHALQRLNAATDDVLIAARNLGDPAVMELVTQLDDLIRKLDDAVYRSSH